MSEQTCRKMKNPPDLLRRVYDILSMHISITTRLRARMKMMMCGSVDHFIEIVDAKV
jgi:hypothetical protein